MIDENLQPKIKRMEKGEANFYTPEGVEYTIMKFYWKCIKCGLIWQTRHEAEECENRGHKDSYQRVYGVTAIVNDKPVGGWIATFRAVRKEV